MRVAPAALDGFTSMIERMGVEFVDDVNFKATEAIAEKLLLTYRDSLLLVSPEKLAYSYVKNGISRINGFFEADNLGVELAGSEEEAEIEKLKSLKTVKEFKVFFDEVGIAYKKNMGEPKCIELFLENKESIDPAKLAEFLGE